MKIKIIFLIFCFLLCCFLINKNYKKPQNKAANEEIKKMSSYEIGYSKGYNSAKRQFSENQENVINDEKVFSFTSSYESTYNEEEIKGYVDGYHKALDAIYCPR